MKPVVGAAILRGGKVLAARRTAPPALAGRWELPGGKVEPGESPEDALVRELEEELGVTVRVGAWLGPRVPIEGGWVLSVAAARLVDEAPLAPTEHDEVRWLGPDELGDVDWADPDRPFLPEVAVLLREALARARGPRAIFFDEDDAHAAAARLGADGWVAEVERERLAGEDDDEDHPWAVLSDAPEMVLELLVDELDGWLDQEPHVPSPPAAAPPPAPLPTQPRRAHRGHPDH
ncbi:(deoxy)nucleoside triphosphate pyrophosphohydrolase [Nocardioides dongkuii]|uniref:(deoxy)nucleoside triphosphate pyrophosphohydrolase n=1 Tax=Nocardioides dongkuii TaxID=2760089 RepID=UPI0015FB040E|nr:(deoxy)nucleoside triphosphate pyrophosphohydrolase [Nocardioides dongkuii]